jgi:hypothetical protein
MLQYGVQSPREQCGEDGMAYSITFNQNDQVLESYVFELESGQDLAKAVERVHDDFRKKHPKISLFDGVTVFYDKD